MEDNKYIPVDGSVTDYIYNIGENASPYEKVFFQAWDNRFGKKIASAKQTPVEETIIIEKKPEAVTVTKITRVKRTAVLVILAVLSLVVVVAAALSYFRIEALNGMLNIFNGADMQTYVDELIDLFGGTAFATALLPGLFLLAGVVLAVIALIVSIVGLCVKSRILFPILYGLLLALVLAAGVFMWVNFDGDIVETLVSEASYWIGYFVIAGLSLAAFILSFFAYKKVKQQVVL